jgi:hypothetical protein
MSLTVNMNETNLNVTLERIPLEGVRFATIHLYVNDEAVEFWDFFNWDEAMCIRESLLEIIWSLNDPKLHLGNDLELTYGNETECIPDVISNADLEFGYKKTSNVVRLIGDKFPISVSGRPGSKDFQGVNSLHAVYEPHWFC